MGELAPDLRSTGSSYALWNPRLGINANAHLSAPGPGIKYALCGKRVADTYRFQRVMPDEVNMRRPCEQCWALAHIELPEPTA